MNKEDIRQKIENVRSGKSTSEIFDKVRPPEEFGDAVELFFNKERNCFKAEVIDPYSKQVYSEQFLTTENDVISFIQEKVK